MVKIVGALVVRMAAYRISSELTFVSVGNYFFDCFVSRRRQIVLIETCRAETCPKNWIRVTQEVQIRDTEHWTRFYIQILTIFLNLKFSCNFSTLLK